MSGGLESDEQRDDAQRVSRQARCTLGEVLKGHRAMIVGPGGHGKPGTTYAPHRAAHMSLRAASWRLVVSTFRLA